MCDCNYYDCKYCGYDESNHYIYENCEDYLIDYIYNKGKWCYLGHKCPIVFLCIIDVFVDACVGITITLLCPIYVLW